MDLNNELYTSTKYILGIMFSALVSLTTFLIKKRSTKMTQLGDSCNEIKNHQNILDIEIQLIKEDITEIKDDLKKILFKL